VGGSARSRAVLEDKHWGTQECENGVSVPFEWLGEGLPKGKKTKGSLQTKSMGVCKAANQSSKGGKGGSLAPKKGMKKRPDQVGPVSPCSGKTSCKPKRGERA